MSTDSTLGAGLPLQLSLSSAQDSSVFPASPFPVSPLPSNGGFAPTTPLHTSGVQSISLSSQGSVHPQVNDASTSSQSVSLAKTEGSSTTTTPVKPTASASKVVEITKIRHDLQEGQVPVMDSNGMVVMNQQTGHPLMNRITVPIFLKISSPVQKDVPKKAGQSAPANQLAVVGQINQLQQGAQTAPATKYWEVPPIYNYGTPENPNWGEVVYTFGTERPVWFNGITEEVKHYEGGGSKTSYRTSCRFPQNEEKSRELVLAHEKLYRTFAAALCVGGINKRVGLSQLDPNNPKEAEIKPLLFQKKDEQGNPMIGKDPLKFFALATKGGKISAVFKRPRIDPNDGMLYKTDGRNFFKFNSKTGLLYSCDKTGNFLQVDHNTNQPIPTIINGSLVPDYLPIEPSMLAKVEFLATPIVRVKHFYGSGTKLSLQEEVIGMIVFDTRESSTEATINAVGATWADVDSNVDYNDLNAKFAALTASGFKEARKQETPQEKGPMQPPGSGNLAQEMTHHGFQGNPGIVQNMTNSGIPSMGSFLNQAPMSSGYPQSIPTNGTIYSQTPTSFQ